MCGNGEVLVVELVQGRVGITGSGKRQSKLSRILVEKKSSGGHVSEIKNGDDTWYLILANYYLLLC